MSGSFVLGPLDAVEKQTTAESDSTTATSIIGINQPFEAQIMSTAAPQLIAHYQTL